MSVGQDEASVATGHGIGGKGYRLRFESLAGHVRIVHWLLEDYIDIDSCDSSCMIITSSVQCY